MVDSEIADPTLGLGQLVSKGLSEPMLRFRIQPGKYKYPNRKRKSNGRVVMGKRQFIPSPTFPEGITFSFPSWFVATVGITAVIIAMGGIEKILQGAEPSEKEWNAMDLVICTTPIGITGKYLGLW